MKTRPISLLCCLILGSTVNADFIADNFTNSGITTENLNQNLANRQSGTWFDSNGTVNWSGSAEGAPASARFLNRQDQLQTELQSLLGNSTNGRIWAYLNQDFGSGLAGARYSIRLDLSLQLFSNNGNPHTGQAFNHAVWRLNIAESATGVSGALANWRVGISLAPFYDTGQGEWQIRASSVIGGSFINITNIPFTPVQVDGEWRTPSEPVMINVNEQLDTVTISYGSTTLLSGMSIAAVFGSSGRYLGMQATINGAGAPSETILRHQIDNFTVSVIPDPPSSLYVAIDGSDSNSGTEQAPFRTLTEARDHARAIIAGGLIDDLRIRIGPGTYLLSDTLTFDSRDSGTSGYAVIYDAADPDNPPTLTGGQPIEGTWVHEGDNIWSILVPGIAGEDWWFRDLFRNDQRQIRARFPNVTMTDGVTIGQPAPANDPDYPDFIRPITDVDMLVVSQLLSSDRTSFRVTGPSFPEVFPDDNAEIVTIGPWSSTRALVREASGDQIDTYQRPGTQGISFYDLMVGRPLYLEHAKAFLEMEGEWFLEKSTGKLYLVSATDPNQDPFWAPRLERLITVKGTSSQPVVNFQLRNLVIEGSSWNIPEGNYIATQAHFYRTVDLQWPVELPEAIRFEHAHSPVVRDCRIAHTGASALAFGRGCQDGRILHNTFEDIGATAISLGDNIGSEKHGDDNGKAIRLRVSHNDIRRFGQTHFGAIGVWQAFCPDSIIEYNRIHEAPYSGISIGWDWTDTRDPAARGQSAPQPHF